MPIRLWFVFWGIYVLTFELWLRNSKFRWKNKWRRSGYWLDSIRRGLHWSETRIFVGLHWIGRLRLPLGKQLNWIAFCELRRVPHLRCFERLDCLGWVDITWIALEVDCIGLKVLYFCWIALDCVREWKAGRYRLDCNWVGLDRIGNSAWYCWRDSFTSGNSNLSNVNHGRERFFLEVFKS